MEEDKKLNFDAPFLSVRRHIRPRINIGSESGRIILPCSCIPFSWEDAPGQPKHSPCHCHDDTEIEDEDEFSDAQMKFTNEEFLDGNDSESSANDPKNVLIDLARFRVQLFKEKMKSSKEEEEDEVEEEDDGDDNDGENVDIEVQKGYGLVRRFWLKNGGPICFVTMSSIVNKHKKNSRTWKNMLKDKLGIRQQSKSSDKRDKEKGSIYLRLPFPSSQYPNLPHGYPLSRAESSCDQDSPKRDSLRATDIIDIGDHAVGYGVLLPMDQKLTDPSYSPDGDIHTKRNLCNDPPILSSPSGSWVWFDGTSKVLNPPNSLFSVQLKGSNDWSKKSLSPSPSCRGVLQLYNKDP